MAKTTEELINKVFNKYKDSPEVYLGLKLDFKSEELIMKATKVNRQFLFSPPVPHITLKYGEGERAAPSDLEAFKFPSNKLELTVASLELLNGHLVILFKEQEFLNSITAEGSVPHLTLLLKKNYRFPIRITEVEEELIGQTLKFSSILIKKGDKND